MKTASIPICLTIAAALIPVGCSSLPVRLTFPDFPEGVVALDLGQSVTIDVAAANDDGKGVTWSCAGTACAPLTSTPVSVTFKAIGITGNAKITATSKKQTAISKSIKVVVGLNDAPDLLCRLDAAPNRWHDVRLYGPPPGIPFISMASRPVTR
jgi:hypothetical protein